MISSTEKLGSKLGQDRNSIVTHHLLLSTTYVASPFITIMGISNDVNCGVKMFAGSFFPLFSYCFTRSNNHFPSC